MEKYNQGAPAEWKLTGKMTAKTMCVGKTERETEIYGCIRKNCITFQADLVRMIFRLLDPFHRTDPGVNGCFLCIIPRLIATSSYCDQIYVINCWACARSHLHSGTRLCIPITRSPALCIALSCRRHTLYWVSFYRFIFIGALHLLKKVKLAHLI